MVEYILTGALTFEDKIEFRLFGIYESHVDAEKAKAKLEKEKTRKGGVIDALKIEYVGDSGELDGDFPGVLAAIRLDYGEVARIESGDDYDPAISL